MSCIFKKNKGKNTYVHIYCMMYSYVVQQHMLLTYIVMLHMENEIGPVLNIPLMVRIQHGNTHDEYTIIKYNSCAFWTANRMKFYMYICTSTYI